MNGSGEVIGSLLPFLLIGLAFYFLILRPQRTRLRQTQLIQRTLAVGVEVMTTSGLFGSVTRVGDEDIDLEVSPGVRLRYARAAVGRIVTPEDGVGGAGTADGDGTTGGSTPA